MTRNETRKSKNVCVCSLLWERNQNHTTDLSRAFHKFGVVVLLLFLLLLFNRLFPVFVVVFCSVLCAAMCCCRWYSCCFVELTKFFAFYYVLLVIGFEFDLHLDLDLHLIDVCLKSDEYNALYDFKSTWNSKTRWGLSTKAYIVWGYIYNTI